MKYINREALRFLISGGANTLFTYLFYLALLNFVEYWVAFSLSFLAGIFFAFYVNCYFVFKVPLAWKRLIQYPVLYMLQYLMGLLLLFILITLLGINEKIAPLINVALLTPISFIANKWFLSGR